MNYLSGAFKTTRITDPAFGAAVRAAMMAIKKTGGRVVSFLSSIPGSGPGSLKPREDRALIGTDKENKLHVPADNYYEQAFSSFLLDSLTPAGGS